MTAALLQYEYKIKAFPLQNSNQQIWTQWPDCDLFPLNAQRTVCIAALIESLPLQLFSETISFNTETQFNALVKLSYFTVCWFMSDQLPHDRKYCHLSGVKPNWPYHLSIRLVLHRHWTLFFLHYFFCPWKLSGKGWVCVCLAQQPRCLPYHLWPLEPFSS